MTLDETRRRLEVTLDELLAAIGQGSPEWQVRFRAAAAASQAAFEAEEALFAELEGGVGRFVEKMRGQHAEALELASAIEESAARGCRNEEMIRLLRSFHAILQHNVIEEDRELFSRLPPRQPGRGSETD